MIAAGVAIYIRARLPRYASQYNRRMRTSPSSGTSSSSKSKQEEEEARSLREARWAYERSVANIIQVKRSRREGARAFRIAYAQNMENAAQEEARRQEAERVEFFREQNWPLPDLSLHNIDFIIYLESVYKLQSHLLQYPGAALRRLPEMLVHFDWIQELNLSENNFSCLPHFIFTLLRLRRVILHSNKLESLPPFGDETIKHLESLDVRNNKLQILPDLSLATNLTSLVAERNHLHLFPSVTEASKRLTHLNLRNNKIRIVPRELGFIPLGFLDLRNNPIENLPPQVYQQGLSKIMAYINGVSDYTKNETVDHRSEFLAKDLLRIISLKDPPLSDITLISSDGIRFKAHKAILAARCFVLAHLMRVANLIPSYLDNQYEHSIASSYSSLKSVDKSSLDPSKVQELKIEATGELLGHLLQYLYGDCFTAPKPMLLKVTPSMTTEEIIEVDHTNEELNKAHRSTMVNLISFAQKFGLPHWQMLIENSFIRFRTLIVDSDWKSQMKALWKEPQLRDVELCGDARLDDVENAIPIPVHKIIVASRSPFLTALLSGHMMEATQQIVTLRNVSTSTLRCLIEFCYTDDVETLDPDHVIELLITAKTYGLDRLFSLVESVVGFSLDVDNVSSILSVAWGHQMPQLARACKFFILSHWSAVSSTKDWLEVDEAVRKKLAETARNRRSK